MEDDDSKRGVVNQRPFWKRSLKIHHLKQKEIDIKEDLEMIAEMHKLFCIN